LPREGVKQVDYVRGLDLIRRNQRLVVFTVPAAGGSVDTAGEMISITENEQARKSAVG